jgi:hypothetical protein
MRVLLRNHRSRLYYVTFNQWGVEHEQAFDFGNLASAARFTFEEKLAEMEIILRYDACDGEIRLPVLREWSLFEERALRPVRDPALPAEPVWSSPSRLS